MQSESYNDSAMGANHMSPTSSLGFLGRLNPDKKQTRDGQPAKRRGPKPDSKPALTRRQELNRQAQRTHRERKEMYIKALEQEVLRLKEVFSTSTRERDAVMDENRRLRELLTAHGISYDFNTTPIQFQRANSGYDPSSSGSISGSYVATSEDATFSPPPIPGQGTPGHSQASISPPAAHATNYASQSRHMGQRPNNQLDYDNIGIDFVLTLERPCMDHMQYLLVRSHNAENQPFHHPMENADDSEHEHMSGHVLMSTAPPQSHIMTKANEQYPYQMPPDMSSQSLTTLLDLSNRLPFDHQSEITPVMAWTLIYRHERLGVMTAEDIDHIKKELTTKVRCYGFGAVLEQFEVRDAVENVLSRKEVPQLAPLGLPTSMPSFPSAQQVSAY